ncbi:MAG: cobalamin-binding protein [Bacteroidetes bacterium]|nr:cobalamin-binding protein [Bacteroidota bacterium]
MHRTSLLTALCLALACSACDRARAPESTPAAHYAVVEVDAMQDTVRLATPARRVISLAPNITEMLFAIGAQDLLIGRTTYCDYPPAATRIEPVADMQQLNYEKIIALKPDLLPMTFVGNMKTSYNKLKELGLRPFELHDSTIGEVIQGFELLGALVGRAEAGKAVAGRLRNTVDSIRRLARNDSVTVFVVIDRAPLMTVSSGFIAEMLSTAGGRNIAGGGVTQYPTYSREELLRLDPEVIIVPGPDWHGVSDLLNTYPEWHQLRAVRTNRVYVLPPDVIERPGPRIGIGLELLYRALHGAEPHRLFEDAQRMANTPT